MAARKKAPVDLKELFKPKIGQKVTLEVEVYGIDESDNQDYIKVQTLNAYEDDYGDLDNQTFWISKAFFEESVSNSIPEIRKAKLQEKIKQATENLAELKKQLANV